MSITVSFSRPGYLGFLSVQQKILQKAQSLQVAELLAGVAAPILYWEQGHEWLFGDPVRFQVRLKFPSVEGMTYFEGKSQLPADQILTTQ